MAFKYTLIDDARHGQFFNIPQKLSKSGLPLCVQCHKTIPPHRRLYAKRTNRPAFFCTNACKQRFAVDVATDVCKPVEWKEPDIKKREATRLASRRISELKPDQIVTRLGKKYVVVHYPRSRGNALVQIDLKRIGGREDGLEETLELDYDCRFVRTFEEETEEHPTVNDPPH